MLWWILAVAAAVWVIYDVMTQQKSMDSTKKLIWIICAVVFSVVTAIVYFFAIKKR